MTVKDENFSFRFRKTSLPDGEAITLEEAFVSSCRVGPRQLVEIA